MRSAQNEGRSGGQLTDWNVADVTTPSGESGTATSLFRLARAPTVSWLFGYLTRSNRRVRDPYARWCDRDSPRGPAYVDQTRLCHEPGYAM